MAHPVNELIGPVHNSHLSAIKQCEQKFDYSFNQQIEAKHPSLPLSRGIWLHYMLEAQHLRWGWEADTLLGGLPEFLKFDDIGECPIIYDEHDKSSTFVVVPELKEDRDKGIAARKEAVYPLSAKGVLDLLTEQVWSRLLPGEHDRYTEDDHTLPEACRRLLREYFYHYNKWPLPEGAKILGVEVNWQREHNGVEFEGKADLVYETNGLVVVRDWKTTKSAPDNEFKFMDSQLNLYPWGLTPWLMEQGYDVKKATHSAVEYDYIMTKLPTTPSLNKDGSVSKRKIATTRLTVMDFVKREGLMWKTQHLDHYLDNYTTGTQFFEQRLVPRNQRVIHRLLEENIATAERMLPILKSERVAIRTVGKHCTFMCDFLPLCKGELYGDDVRYIRKTEYQPRNYLAHDREKDD